jgi:hypothetical protein
MKVLRSPIARQRVRVSAEACILMLDGLYC